MPSRILIERELPFSIKGLVVDIFECRFLTSPKMNDIVKNREDREVQDTVVSAKKLVVPSPLIQVSWSSEACSSPASR
jgi:hypothetical protein